MSDLFIRSNNLKEYLKEAMTIYIASAYFNKAVIDKIKEDLESLPYQGGKQFRFLLNHDFHEDESMRQVLLNQLLTIPNTEVRVYEGPKVFHPKLYLFENGNRVFTAIGSFNATSGGMGGNIEAGVKLGSREIFAQAKSFFDEYWDSSRVAVIVPDAQFFAKKFQPGDGVLVISSNKNGVITNHRSPLLVNGVWEYPVNVDGRNLFIMETDLTAQKIVDYSNEFTFDTVAMDGCHISEWFNDYFLDKIYDMPDTMLASYKTSRTRSIAYQFRPLFKITSSKEKRLLIADEVGLGKTIEAGIILKEYIYRYDAKNILIIVPNSLKFKWKDELQLRFEEFFELMNASDFNEYLDNWEQSKTAAPINAIVSYDTLASPSVSKRIAKMTNLPVFDFVIVDEAHNLKNPSTIRHKVVKSLTRSAKAMLMLTATPIQIAPENLFYLLQLLLPNSFGGLSLKAFKPLLAVNEYLNKAINFLKGNEIARFHDQMREIKTSRFTNEALQTMSGFDGMLQECEAVTDKSDGIERRKLIDKIYSFNIFNQYITRTLRQDVSEKFADRDIQTVEYEYTEQEAAVYKAFVDFAVKNSKTNSALQKIMPERRAASSLYGVMSDFKTAAGSALFNECDDSNTSDYED
jgi:HKD family nuclease